MFTWEWFPGLKQKFEKYLQPMTMINLINFGAGFRGLIIQDSRNKRTIPEISLDRDVVDCMFCSKNNYSFSYWHVLHTFGAHITVRMGSVGPVWWLVKLGGHSAKGWIL